MNIFAIAESKFLKLWTMISRDVSDVIASVGRPTRSTLSLGVVLRVRLECCLHGLLKLMAYSCISAITRVS